MGSSCAECSGEGASACRGCARRFFLAQSGECTDQCAEGEFGDDGTGACQPCPTGCARCSAVQCLECALGSFRVAHPAGGVVCVAVCPAGTFEDAKRGVCADCVSQCDAGFFLSGECSGTAGPVCRPCDSACLSCKESASVCTGCGRFSYLWSGACKRCTVACADGQYLVG